MWHGVVLGETLFDEDGTVSSLMPFAWADKAKNCTKDAAGPVGDYGMLSMHDPRGIADGTPRTHFFTYALFALTFGARAVATTVSTSAGCGSGLHAYGSTFDGGEVGVFPGEPSVAETGQGRVFVAGTGKILLFPHKRFCVYDLATDAITY